MRVSVDFAETLRSAHSNARRFAAPRFSAARIVVFVYNLLRKDRFLRQTVCNSAYRAILRNLSRRPCATFYGRAGLRFGRAPRHSTKSPSPPFEHGYGNYGCLRRERREQKFLFRRFARSPLCVELRNIPFPPFSPYFPFSTHPCANCIIYFLAPLACHAIASATAEPAAGLALHLVRLHLLWRSRAYASHTDLQ